MLSLKGEDGSQGVDGDDGPAGQDGLSAYQIAVNGGFDGTEQEWIDSLQGSPIWETLPTNDIYYNGGNVGINTNSPSESLEVSGNLKVSGKIIIDGVDEGFSVVSLDNLQTDQSTFTIDGTTSRLHKLNNQSDILSDDITVNVENLNVAESSSANLSIVVQQGTSPILVKFLQIDGSPINVLWLSGDNPVGTASGVDIFSFSIFRDSQQQYTVLAQIIDFIAIQPIYDLSSTVDSVESSSLIEGQSIQFKLIGSKMTYGPTSCSWSVVDPDDILQGNTSGSFEIQNDTEQQIVTLNVQDDEVFQGVDRTFTFRATIDSETIFEKVVTVSDAGTKPVLQNLTSNTGNISYGMLQMEVDVTGSFLYNVNDSEFVTDFSGVTINGTTDNINGSITYTTNGSQNIDKILIPVSGISDGVKYDVYFPANTVLDGNKGNDEVTLSLTTVSEVEPTFDFTTSVPADNSVNIDFSTFNQVVIQVNLDAQNPYSYLRSVNLELITLTGDSSGAVTTTKSFDSQTGQITLDFSAPAFLENEVVSLNIGAGALADGNTLSSESNGVYSFTMRSRVESTPTFDVTQSGGAQPYSGELNVNESNISQILIPITSTHEIPVSDLSVNNAVINVFSDQNDQQGSSVRSGPSNVSIVGTNLIIPVVSQSLQQGTTYTVLLGEGAVSDGSAQSSNLQYSFETTDISVKPTFTTLSTDTGNSESFNITQLIVGITPASHQNLEQGNGTIDLIKDPDGTPVIASSVNFTVDFNNNQILINLSDSSLDTVLTSSDKLFEDTKYNVVLKPDVLKDKSKSSDEVTFTVTTDNESIPVVQNLTSDTNEVAFGMTKFELDVVGGPFLYSSDSDSEFTTDFSGILINNGTSNIFGADTSNITFESSNGQINKLTIPVQNIQHSTVYTVKIPADTLKDGSQGNIESLPSLTTVAEIVPTFDFENSIPADGSSGINYENFNQITLKINNLSYSALREVDLTKVKLLIDGVDNSNTITTPVFSLENKTIVIPFNYSFEGNEEVVINLESGAIADGTTPNAISTGVYNFTMTDASPIYSLSASSGSVDEGSTVNLSLTVTNMEHTNLVGGEVYPFTISGTNIDTNDFVGLDSLGAGEFTIDANGDASYPLVINADKTTEGSETFTVSLDGLSQSLTVNINDTSFPTYNLTTQGNVTDVDEGETLTVNLQTTNVDDGTVLVWEVSRPEDFSVSTGNFTISSNQGTFDITPISDSTTELAEETFVIYIKRNGETVLTSNSITINDTSQDPVPVPVYSLTVQGGLTAINESGNITLLLQTQNVPENQPVPFTISGTNIDTNDFVGLDSLGAGEFVVDVNGDASYTLYISEDKSTENLETFTVTLDGIGENVSVNINDTSQDPTYTLSVSSDPVDEGDSVTLTLETTDVDEGTVIPFTISGDDIDTNDFVGLDSLGAGEFTIDANGDADYTLTINNDETTENLESFTVTLDGIGESISVDISDTSKSPPTYILNYLSNGNVSDENGIVWNAFNEGETITLTLQTSNVDEGTVIPFTISGTNIDTNDFVGLDSLGTGEFVVGADGTDLYLLEISEDRTTEGLEDFTVSLDGISQSINLEIHDTSLDPTYTFTSVTPSSTVDEGTSVTVTLETERVDEGTAIPFTISGTNIDTNDFVGLDSLGAGEFVVDANGESSYTFNISEDKSTEGNLEIFTVTLDGIGEFVNVGINDTSQDPTYTLSSSVDPVSEGGSVTLTLETTDVDEGTVIPFTISGDDIDTNDFVGLDSLGAGEFTIDANGDADYVLTINNDETTENLESFTVTLDGIGESISVDISDTSTTPVTETKPVLNTSGASPAPNDSDVDESSTTQISIPISSSHQNALTINQNVIGVNDDGSNNARTGASNASINSNNLIIPVSLTAEKTYTVSVGAGGLSDGSLQSDAVSYTFDTISAPSEVEPTLDTNSVTYNNPSVYAPGFPSPSTTQVIIPISSTGHQNSPLSVNNTFIFAGSQSNPQDNSIKSGNAYISGTNLIIPVTGLQAGVTYAVVVVQGALSDGSTSNTQQYSFGFQPQP